MVHLIFVAPFAMEATLRFVRGAARLPGVRLGILSQEPKERLPRDVLGHLSAFERVGDANDAAQLEEGVRRLAHHWGGRVDRLIGILEQLQEPIAAVRESLGIRGMSVAEAKNFRDKARMKTALREAGVPCARHAVAESAEEALTLAEECGYPLVAKPPDGAGARNTVRVETREELASYLRSVPVNAEAPLLLEEFILGREHSFDSVTLNGEHVFHSISYYWPTPLEVMENPFLQWCVVLPRKIDGAEHQDIFAAGRQALDALGMVTGLSHMEWFRRKDGTIAVSEVAARPPGAQFTTLLSAAHDRDFYTDWARLMAFEEFEVPERPFAAGAAFLRARGSGRVKAIHGVEEAREEFGSLVVDARLPKIGQAQASSYEGEGYVVLRHPETEVVERALVKLVNLIRIELE